MKSPFLALKILVLMFGNLFFCCALACAAPAKRPQWEYATVNFSASQNVEGNRYRYGVELIFPNKKAIFLEVKNAGEANYKNYLLNRLGAQGWELIFVPGYRSSDKLYIFKRQK